MPTIYVDKVVDNPSIMWITLAYRVLQCRIMYLNRDIGNPNKTKYGNYMVILLKRKHLKFIALFLLLTTLGIVGISGLIKGASSSPASTVIVLDAGHGGVDLGVIGTDSGVAEKEINLIIVKKLEKKLKEHNIQVVLTRKDSEGLYKDKTPGFKLRDMKERKRIIESANARLVVSVHCNKFPRQDVRGAQVFYEPTSPQSIIFAKCIQANLNVLNREYVGRSYQSHAGDYYILKCSPYPSVIVECGFLSNPQDDKLLNTSAYQDKITYAIFSGIIGYLAEN